MICHRYTRQISLLPMRLKFFFISLALSVITSTLSAQHFNLTWITPAGSVGNDWAISVCVDTNGNVYSTGYFNGTVNFGSGHSPLYSPGDYDMFIQKVDKHGNLLWIKQIGGMLQQTGGKILLSSDGDLYVAAMVTGASTLDPSWGSGFSLDIIPGQALLILKLDVQGNLKWLKQLNGLAADGMVRDAQDNLYITSIFSGTVDFDPGSGIEQHTAVDNPFGFVLKLNALGEFVWVKILEGGISVCPADIGVDDQQQVYVTGYFTGNMDTDPSASTNIFVSGIGGVDGFIIKLDENGNYLWSKQAGTLAGGCFAIGICIDEDQQVYTSGFFTGPVNFDPTGTNFTIDAGPRYASYVQKCDTDGNSLWVKIAQGNPSITSNAICMDKDQNIYTTGFALGTTDFDPSTANHDVTFTGSYLLKWDKDGVYQDVYTFPSTDIATGEQITVDEEGNLYLCGSYRASTNFDPGRTNLTFTAAGEEDLFVLKLSPEEMSRPTDLFIPNMFTPNADGLNDVFEIRYQGTASYQLDIYNRWGSKVFSTNDRKIQWKGEQASEGIYYYSLDIGGTIHSGWVQIVK